MHCVSVLGLCTHRRGFYPEYEWTFILFFLFKCLHNWHFHFKKEKNMKEPLVKFKAEFAVILKKICNISQKFFY